MNRTIFKVILFIAIIMSGNFVHGQDGKLFKSEFKVQDGLYRAEIGLSTQLSERWTLHRNVAVSYNNDAARFELPILFRYRVTKQLSLYGGVKGYRVGNTPSYNNIAPIAKFGAGSLMGVEFEVSNSFFFKAQYDTNFSMDQNSLLLGLENNRNGGSFHFGYSF